MRVVGYACFPIVAGHTFHTSAQAHAVWRRLGMTDLRLSIEETQDAITGAQPTVRKNTLPHPPTLVPEPEPPVLISEQEVMLGTAAAVRPGSTQITRQMINALHVVGAALRPPPPRPHYARRAYYLERAAMSREMDRL